LQKECKSQSPFLGAVELATLAKQRNVISDARLGLADICAAVLHQRLDKEDFIRLRSDWNATTLTDEQVQYAAKDAYASLQIYERLSQMTVPTIITDSALPGTPVSVLHDDGKAIALGILSQEAQTASLKGVNHTKTRARVTVRTVLVPAAILPLHHKSLESFGPTPFDIIVTRSKLRSHTLPPTSMEPPSGSGTIPKSSAAAAEIDHELAEFLSQPVSAEGEWFGDVDESSDITEEQDDISTAEVDEASVQAASQCLPDTPSSWPPLVRSRVLMDPYHAMARIKVPRNHGFTCPFARALRDAIFIPDEEDRARIASYLTSNNSSWDEVLRFNPQWLWKRCKRIIPPPELLYSAVCEVYKTFGPLLDSKTGAPLFNTQAWKDARNIMKSIQAGLLSDPLDVPLYFRIGLDKKHGNLALYRCCRGINNTEGGVHHSGCRHLPISGASPRHASARVRDFVLMHNLMVGEFQ
jgi:hypothetical protein